MSRPRGPSCCPAVTSSIHLANVCKHPPHARAEGHSHTKEQTRWQPEHRLRGENTAGPTEHRAGPWPARRNREGFLEECHLSQDESGQPDKHQQQQSTRKGQRQEKVLGQEGTQPPGTGARAGWGWAPGQACGPHPRAAGSPQRASGAGVHTALACTWKVGPGREARRTGRAARRSCSRRRRKRADGGAAHPHFSLSPSSDRV